MDPYQDPTDEQIAAWARLYGTTGVKTYELDLHPDNVGCVAVYRESSLEERSLLARLEALEEEAPGVYDYMRMFVSSCLLYPQVESYPQPAFAIAELFPRIRQHGHGLLPDEDGEPDALPGHSAQDIRRARQSAHQVFHDAHYGSFYKSVVLDLATLDGQLDVGLFDKLWRMPPGRLRDVLARAEQAHMELRDAAFAQVSQLRGDEKKEAAQRIEQLYPNLMQALDEASGGATIPHPEESEEDEVEAPEPATNDNLPPNRPPTPEEIRRAIES